MRFLKLPNGERTKVDDEVYEDVVRFRWCRASGGYVQRRVKRGGKAIFLHRLINQTPDGLETDHVNGNVLDNRRVNLRTVTRSQNCMNRRKFRRTSSRKKGVDFYKRLGKWRARIQADGISKDLGLFLTEKEASAVYKAAAIELHGSYARVADLAS